MKALQTEPIEFRIVLIPVEEADVPNQTHLV